MFKAFKNFEDNIEYLSKDINEMENKIEEVNFKLSQLREKSFVPSVFVKNVPKVGVNMDLESDVKTEVELMKGSTLNIQIVEGLFDD